MKVIQLLTVSQLALCAPDKGNVILSVLHCHCALAMNMANSSLRSDGVCRETFWTSMVIRLLR